MKCRVFQIMGRFLYKAMHDDNWGEHELDYVIVLLNCDPKQIRPNPEEVEAVAVVSSMEELTEILKSAFFKFFQMHTVIIQEQCIFCLCCISLLFNRAYSVHR